MMNFGKIQIDPVAYGSQGNAILGIRDSGKTWTATMLAEQLFESNVPFIAFDPIGVWKWLRVPGAGRGYPIVVAGGADGDLPLSVQNAETIVRAAMQNGVSLVLDLFDMNLSKADWRRIVKSSVRVLLHENQAHGLRHIFIEEAAEFVPQKILDGDVYAEIEKLARMGGNCRLGYTLINQRAQEVNKAVLELCENLFLHRQRGKNALDSLHKWLDAADVGTAKAVMKTLPDLPKGECWAWMGGDDPKPPARIKVPAKNSAHPDRRVMRGAAQMHEVAVSLEGVTEFVRNLKETIAVAGNKDGYVRVPGPDGKPVKWAGSDAALATDRAAVERQREITVATDNGRALGRIEMREAIAGGHKYLADTLHDAANFARECRDRLSNIEERIANAVTVAERLRKQINEVPSGVPLPAGNAKIQIDLKHARRAPQSKPAGSNGSLPRSQQRVISSVAFWHSHGDATPKREAVAAVAGYAPRSGGFNNLIGALHEADLLGLPGRGLVALNDRTVSSRLVGTVMTPDQAEAMLRRPLSPPMRRVLDAVVEYDGQRLSREHLAHASGYAANSGGFNNLVGKLCSMDITVKPHPGCIALSDWARKLFMLSK